MLSIKTVLMPFNLKLSNRKPIDLKVVISNKSSEKKLLSLSFMVSRELAVEDTGMNNRIEKKLGELEPGASKIMYFPIYPKVSTNIRDYPARLKIYEYYNDYNFIQKEFKKDFIVKVIN